MIASGDWKSAAATAQQSYDLGPKVGALCARNLQTLIETRSALGDDRRRGAGAAAATELSGAGAGAPLTGALTLVGPGWVGMGLLYSLFSRVQSSLIFLVASKASARSQRACNFSSAERSTRLPASVCLFFACAKKSHQKKHTPATALALRASALCFSPEPGRRELAHPCAQTGAPFPRPRLRCSVR